jgi:hypothetical protein
VGSSRQGRDAHPPLATDSNWASGVLPVVSDSLHGNADFRFELEAVAEIFGLQSLKSA